MQLPTRRPPYPRFDDQHLVFGRNTDDGGLVAHYTRAETFERIEENGSLLLNRFARSNDPREARPGHVVTLANGGVRPPQAEITALEQSVAEVWGNIRMTCWTRGSTGDVDLEPVGHAMHRPFALPDMWAHYAGESSPDGAFLHTGVCLVAARAYLRHTIEDQLTAYSLTFADVDYPTRYDDCFYRARAFRWDGQRFEGRDGPSLQDRGVSCLSRKHPAWTSEREWRAMIADYPPDHDSLIELRPGVVVGLVLGVDFDDALLPVVERLAATHGIENAVAQIALCNQSGAFLPTVVR